MLRTQLIASVLLLVLVSAFAGKIYFFIKILIKLWNNCLAPERSCPENEEYTSCGTACPPTCQNKSPQICTDNCVEGCFCKKGYIRQGPGGRCVPESCKSKYIFFL